MKIIIALILSVFLVGISEAQDRYEIVISNSVGSCWSLEEGEWKEIPCDKWYEKYKDQKEVLSPQCKKLNQVIQEQTKKFFGMNPGEGDYRGKFEKMDLGNTILGMIDAYKIVCGEQP